MIYLIVYDCDGDDAALAAVLGRYDAVPVAEGAWLLETDKAAKTLRAALKRATAEGRCRIFVARLRGEYADLNLPAEAADWLDDRDEWDFD